MSRIVIVGAGDFGRELHSWVLDNMFASERCPVVFVDDHESVLSKHPHLSQFLVGTVRDFFPVSGDKALMGVSSPKAKALLASKLRDRGVDFQTFIHKSAIVAKSAEIGYGSILCPYSVVSSDAKIKQFVTLNIASTVGHDAEIGNYVSLMSHVDVTGWVEIGEGSFLGSHASVLPKVVVESNATIGAGSVAIRRVKANSTVVGVPARPLRK